MNRRSRASRQTMNAQTLSVNWPAPQTIGALMTTRSGGVSRQPYQSFNLGTHVGDLNTDVLHNRERLIKTRQLHSVAWLNQVHGTDVVEIKDTSFTNSIPAADASYTRVPGIACAVLVADCMPVLVTDQQGSCVGVAHAGWRGLCAGVIPNLLSKMGLETEQIIVWLGPCIGPDVFEVGPEVLGKFRTSQTFQGTDVASAFHVGSGDRYMADLAHLAKMQLYNLGIEKVFDANECTFSNEKRYFSYRRDGITGRMAALIWVKNQLVPV